MGFPSLDIGIDGIAKRPRTPEAPNEMGDYLSVAVMVDEEVSYGAPAAIFIPRLADLMKAGFGLEETNPRQLGR